MMEQLRKDMGDELGVSCIRKKKVAGMQREEQGESLLLFLGMASLLYHEVSGSQDSLRELNSSREGEYDGDA